MIVLNHDPIPPYLTNFRCVAFTRAERDMRGTSETQLVQTKCMELQVPQNEQVGLCGNGSDLYLRSAWLESQLEC